MQPYKSSLQLRGDLRQHRLYRQSVNVPKKLLKGLLAAMVLIPVGLVATPASAAPPADNPEYPWRQNQWPQTQPWQLDADANANALRSAPSTGI
jgi:hypothetical protein